MKLLCLILVCAMVAALPAMADTKRPMTIDDLFKFKRVADPQISPDGQWVVYAVTTVVDVAGNKTQSNLWLAPAAGGEPRQLTTTDKKDRHPKWSPDGKQVLFESNRSGESQLWVIDVGGGEARQLTKISTEAGNALWSRDGKKIAFVSAVYPEYSEKPFKESDEANKKKIDENSKNAVKAKVFKRLFYRHWDSYVEDKRQHLFVMNPDGTGVHDATPGDRDAYPTSTTFETGDNFTFSPDGKYLVFTAVPAAGEAWSTNHDLCRVSIDNTSPKWETLTVDNPAADSGPIFSPDGTKLAYRAQKKTGYEADKWVLMVASCSPDGRLSGPAEPWTDRLSWGHGVNGGVIMQPVLADVAVNDYVWLPDGTLVIAVDSGASHTLFHLTSPNVGDRWRSGGLLGPLSAGRGGVAYTRSTLDAPNEVCFRALTAERDIDVNLSHANDPLLAELNRPRPESVAIPVEGDVKMQMWILKPPGFDPKKKYPVAFLVHGGPQGAWEDGWSFRWCPELWAAQGYIVALPNPRGSTGFGQKFVDEISGDWGGKCYRDLMAGADYVETLPYVDKARIGAAGASFGGYMMDWFAVSTGRFKCLISHCSVWNFESMWGTTEELWFDEYEHGGLPWEIPGKYREFSPHTKAGNLGKFKTPMLLIQNDLDFRCPIGQGHELFSALQRQGVKSKFINFPDEGHWVTKPANSKFWHEQVFAWLKEHVEPGGK